MPGMKVVDTRKFAPTLALSAAVTYVAPTPSSGGDCSCRGCAGCAARGASAPHAAVLPTVETRSASQVAVLRTVDTRRFAAPATPSAATAYLDKPVPRQPTRKPIGRVTPTGLIVGAGPRGEPRHIFEREPRPVPDELRLRSSGWLDPGEPGRFPCSRMEPPQCDPCGENERCYQYPAGFGMDGLVHSYFCLDRDAERSEVRNRAASLCREFLTEDFCLYAEAHGGLVYEAGCGWRCGDDRMDQSERYRDPWDRRTSNPWDGWCP